MINVAVAVIENYVLVQILDMPRELRGVGTIFRNAGFDIRSSHCPELEINRFYLWGDDTDKDNMVCVRDFRTNSDAMEYAKKLCDTIDKYNNTHGCNKNIKIETDFFSNNKSTNEKLTFEIILWGGMLIIKNTDIKTADRGVKQIEIDNYYILQSSNRPALEGLHRLYVRGTNKELDNTIIVIQFGSFERAKQYIERLRKATKIWNDNDDDEVKVFTYIPIT